MDIKQDPNSIPNFNAGGRMGELQPNEPEQAQSSVELDPTAGGDGGASGYETAESDIPAGSGRDSQLDNGSSATSLPVPPTAAEAGGPPVDPSKAGADAIDEPAGGGFRSASGRGR